MIWEPIIWNTTHNQLFFVESFFSFNQVIIGILVSHLLVFIGLFGLVRRTVSILLLLLCFELILLGLNLSIILVGLLLNQPICLIVSMVFFILSAVETAIGLSLVFVYYKVFNTTSLQQITIVRF